MSILYHPSEELKVVARQQLGTRMEPTLQRLAGGKSTCEATLFTKDNEIRSAVVLFPAERPKNHMRACVVEELTQVLGLPNDSPSVSPSIFNDKSPINELTDHDRLMLRMLYDPRITIGMSRDRALIVGRKVLDEIRPERVVADALRARGFAGPRIDRQGSGLYLFGGFWPARRLPPRSAGPPPAVFSADFRG